MGFFRDQTKYAPNTPAAGKRLGLTRLAPAVQYTHGATIAVPNAGGGLFVNPTTPVYDTHGIASVVGGILRYTVPRGFAGLWAFAAGGAYAPSAGGTLRQVAVRVNGANYRAIGGGPPNGASYETSVACYREFVLAEGDYLECRFFQDSGGALFVSASDYSPYFLARYLRSS